MNVKPATISRTAEQPNSNNHVLVSIIIPAYNTEKYVHRAIESSIRQTHKNIEVIVIDDGSKDNTLEVARRYAEKDSRVRVFHKENGGVSSARNMGIREAHGEYITFLDSDDWFEDCAVESLLEAQINHPNKFVSGDVYSVSYDEAKNVFRRPVHNHKIESRDTTVEEALAAIHEIRLYFLHSKIYVADTIRKYKLHFRENIHYGEDFVFNFEYLCKIGRMFYLSKPVLNLLSRSDSAMHVPYEQRRIFVNGKFNDFVQVMVENPDNTQEITRLSKIIHTERCIGELWLAFISKADYGKIKQVRKAARMYTREYLSANTVTLKEKLVLICRAYLPVSVSKGITLLILRMRNILHLLNRNEKIQDEEIIPYW